MLCKKRERKCRTIRSRGEKPFEGQEEQRGVRGVRGVGGVRGARGVRVRGGAIERR